MEWLLGQAYQGGRIRGQGNQAQPGQGHRGQHVQEKTIAYTTDSKLLNRGWQQQQQQLAQLVAEAGMTLRQNYNRIEPPS